MGAARVPLVGVGFYAMYNAPRSIAMRAQRLAAAKISRADREYTMPMNKPHLEFHKVDMDQGWATPPGYPAGIQQKILASDLDETRKMGSRTRLLRFAPGVYTTAPFVHDHWEEVYLISGDLVVGNDDKGKGGEPFEAPTYACRPPGVHHGPFKSERGCMLYEIHYYDEGRN
jgi:ChrR-like protein with cupin domain